jgi:hypothetical protein
MKLDAGELATFATVAGNRAPPKQRVRELPNAALSTAVHVDQEAGSPSAAPNRRGSVSARAMVILGIVSLAHDVGDRLAFRLALAIEAKGSLGAIGETLGLGHRAQVNGLASQLHRAKVFGDNGQLGCFLIGRQRDSVGIGAEPSSVAGDLRLHPQRDFASPVDACNPASRRPAVGGHLPGYRCHFHALTSSLTADIISAGHSIYPQSTATSSIVSRICRA